MGEEGAELWNLVSDRLNIPIRRDKMEVIDRKFTFKATSIGSGKAYTQKNALVFLAKDKFLPELLDAYYKICVREGADERQIMGVVLLKERVLAWQRKNEKKVHLPDVKPGKEEQRVCKENKC